MNVLIDTLLDLLQEHRLVRGMRIINYDRTALIIVSANSTV